MNTGTLDSRLTAPRLKRTFQKDQLQKDYQPEIENNV